MHRGSRRTLSVPVISYEDVDLSQAPLSDMSGYLGPVPQELGTPAWSPQLQQGAAISHGQFSGGGQLATPPLMSRSRSASTSSLNQYQQPGSSSQQQKKKIVTACQRCRTRKIRCDGVLPACRSCVKAGVECIEVDRSGDNNLPRSHILELEKRIQWLEDIITAQCPDVDLSTGPPVELRSLTPHPGIRVATSDLDLSSPGFAQTPVSATSTSFDYANTPPTSGGPSFGHGAAFSDAGISPTPSPGPSSPLVGGNGQHNDAISREMSALSIFIESEPRYLGPASGVNFARMLFAEKHPGAEFEQSENWLRDQKSQVAAVEPAGLPAADECILLVNTYFETVHLQYPFMHRPTFQACLEAVYQADTGTQPGLPQGFTLATARFHVFLVLSVAASILSSRTLTLFPNSEGYFSSAMRVSDEISLTGSLLSLQSCLLLAMRSLYTAGGPNVWYINALTIATIIDLGLHRKLPASPKAALKCRIFWSAYSLDRNLGISLGRPYGLRDDAFDVDFPAEHDNDEELTTTGAAPSRIGFFGSIYLFRMIKAISTIHSTLHPIKPTYTPDPAWQLHTFRDLSTLRDQSHVVLSRRNTPGALLVELKFHEAVMLLFRPSPAFPRPNLLAMQQTYASATATIRIYAQLHAQAEMPHTRLVAHSVFFAGITMLYAGREQHKPQEMAECVGVCAELLGALSRVWPVAGKSRERFMAAAEAAAGGREEVGLLVPGVKRAQTFPMAQGELAGAIWVQGAEEVGDLSWMDAVDWGCVGAEGLEGAGLGGLGGLDEDTTMWGQS